MSDVDARQPATGPGQRGRLDIAERVVERIASIAAAEVPGVLTTGSTLEGVLGRRYPQAGAEVAGRHATVSVDVAVAWAAALADTAASVRDRVQARVQDLAGLHVDAVHVTVANVILEAPDTQRRVQ